MTWMIAFIAALVLLAAAVGACAWLAADRRSLVQDRDRLHQEREQAQQAEANLRRENERLSNEIAQYKQKQQDLQQQHEAIQKQFDQAQKQLRESFQNLANEALDRSSKRFVEIAKDHLDGKKTEFQNVLDQRKQAVEQLVKPVRETLDKYQQNLQQMEKSRHGAYKELSQQVQQMAQDQRMLQQETRNLVQALRRPEGRGRWGEMQLKRVAELAGMIEHCDFYEQSSVEGEGGKLRPDMLVKLPGERNIIVDAKTPVDAFINAVQSEEQDPREQYMQQHVRQIEHQAQQLAKKEYWAQFEHTPDFVVMFIPGESFLHAAAQRKPDLMENAMNRGVVIATPTTLISLLKVVALGWREERIAESAKHISDLGQELHERIATVTGHVEKLGKSLDQATSHYNKFVGSFESRVLSSARKFKELGADSSKELPADGEVQPIETSPRELRSTGEE